MKNSSNVGVFAGIISLIVAYVSLLNMEIIPQMEDTKILTYTLPQLGFLIVLAAGIGITLSKGLSAGNFWHALSDVSEYVQGELDLSDKEMERVHRDISRFGKEQAMRGLDELRRVNLTVADGETPAPDELLVMYRSASLSVFSEKNETTKAEADSKIEVEIIEAQRASEDHLINNHKRFKITIAIIAAIVFLWFFI